MTNEERWKIEGRTREALRDARKSLAALRIEIEEHAEKLLEAAASLKRFLEKPTGAGPTGMTSRQYTAHFFRTMIPPEVDAKLAEFETLSEKITDLERQVRDFGE